MGLKLISQSDEPFYGANYWLGPAISFILIKDIIKTLIVSQVLSKY